MSLRFLVPVLAATAAIPMASAAEIVAGDVKLKIGVRLQSRAEVASASSADGATDRDIWSGTNTDEAKDFNFYFRRIRLGFSGSYKDDTTYNLVLASDNLGRTGNGRASDSATLGVRYATVAHTFKGEGMSHTIKFGLDKPKLVAGHFDSSSGHLFPTPRATINITTGDIGGVDRKIGLEYQLSTSLLNLWAGFFEADANNDDDRNDSLFAVRVESSFNDAWKTSRRESYLGKEDGFKHVLGAGFGIVSDGGEDEDGVTIITADYAIHYNQLSALLDLAVISREDEDAGGALIVSLQAGWAIKLGSGSIIEPALRFALIDLDDDEDDEPGEYAQEGGASGTYIDLGVNYYIGGKQNNKFQAAVTLYAPEEGDGDATIFRLAHQLNF